MECVQHVGLQHRHAGVIVIDTLGPFEGCAGCEMTHRCDECACPKNTMCENQTAVFDIACEVLQGCDCGANVSSLFTNAPAVLPDGTVTFELFPYASGAVECNISMRDQGSLDGTSLHAVSGPKHLKITVLPVNKPPSYKLVLNDIFLIEDEGMREMQVAHKIYADGMNGTTERHQVPLHVLYSLACN